MAKFIVNCDGGSRGNPGPSAIGVVLWDENRNRVKSYKQFLGTKTNNEAEYMGLLKALDMGCEAGADELQVVMDSELVVKQMNSEYNVNSPTLQPLHAEANRKASRIDKVSFTHVRRNDRYQAEADRLVNVALDQRN